MRRNHIDMIVEMEKVRGGNGGDLSKINEFMEYVDGITNEELAVLDGFADSLKGFTGSLIEQRNLRRVK